MTHIRSFLVLLILLASAPGAFSEQDCALTIAGQTVSFTEANIYIVNAEKEYAGVAEYYSDYLGIDYWSLTYANGMTVSQMIKSDVFDQIKSMNVFYAMALENGMQLSEEERNACLADAHSAYQALSVTDAERVDPDQLPAVFEKQLLAGRMYSVCLENASVDENAVRSRVKREDYVLYEVEYLFRSFEDFDENGKSSSLTSSKQREIEQALADAKHAASFEDVPSLYPSFDILYGNTSLLSGDDTVDARLIDAAEALAIGETSDIVTTDYGLFLIRLIDNTNLSAYEQAVGSALYAAREDAFKAEKEALLRKCEYEINVSFWNTLAPGASAQPD